MADDDLEENDRGDILYLGNALLMTPPPPPPKKKRKKKANTKGLPFASFTTCIATLRSPWAGVVSV